MEPHYAPLKGCAVPKLKFEGSFRRLAEVCEEHFVMIVGQSVNQPRQPREQAEGAHQTALCDGRAEATEFYASARVFVQVNFFTIVAVC